MNSITDIMPLLTSNFSFAYELLTVARMNELINEIKKLSKEVELYREIDTENAIYQPGKVNVFEVNVRCRGNELCVIKKVHKMSFISYFMDILSVIFQFKRFLYVVKRAW